MSPDRRLSLSTCWCSARHTSGYEMIEEIRELGFSRVELSHGVRMTLVEGILQAVDEKLIEVSSVHNFCPLPNFVQHAAPNLFQPSAKKQSERDLWMRYSSQSLEFAARVGAGKMVLHSGSGSFLFRSPAAQLEAPDLTDEERAQAYEKLQKKCGLSSRSLERTISAYRELIPVAHEYEVQLCAENREGNAELPLDADFPEFLARINEATDSVTPVAYWHDTGHAQIKHGLSLLDHEDHLAKMVGRLAGFHLHDVDGDGRDHQTIGTGTIDFAMISRYVRPEHTLILELSPRLSKSQVLQSRDYILDAFEGTEL